MKEKAIQQLLNMAGNEEDGTLLKQLLEDAGMAFKGYFKVVKCDGLPAESSNQKIEGQ